MNKLFLPGVVWLASDIHLGPHTPATQRAFHAFLDKACAQADALILCGDIFDAWVGDDVALANPEKWLADSLQKFKQVAATIPLFIGRGNRDFLIGPQLVEYLGAQLLPETVCLSTDHQDVLLSHGDEYCTADSSYQRFRRIVRNPLIQRAFLALSLRRRRQIADWARNRSQSANRYKAGNIMDVTPSAIEKAYTATGLTTIVHGHTHRPAIHRLQVNSQSCTRAVLPDWDFDHGAARGGWLSIDQHGLSLHMADAELLHV
ncbi:MAG TPA: UDP-2,3-diacylglucosamine diphosphatase [Eoetvoesiella sp.]